MQDDQHLEAAVGVEQVLQMVELDGEPRRRVPCRSTCRRSRRADGGVEAGEVELHGRFGAGRGRGGSKIAAGRRGRRESIVGEARGVSVAQAHACLANTAAAEQVGKDAQAFSDQGVDSTPTLMINGTKTDVTNWADLEPMLQKAGAR